MKTFIAIIFAVITLAIFSQNTFAGSVPATPFKTRTVVTSTKIHFVRFHEYYADYYKEVTDKNGNVTQVIDGLTIYVYYTYTYKTYPVYGD